jgi:hypothetical protein
MNSEQFAYWLQGFAEMNGDTPPSYEQWKMIKEHLSLVFKKVTPTKFEWTPPLPGMPTTLPYIRPGPYIGDQPYPPGQVICGYSQTTTYATDKDVK